MTPQEIVSHLHQINRQILQSRADTQELMQELKQEFNPEPLLALMDAAAMRGFQFGSNVAMSMVQGALLVQLVRLEGARKKRLE